MEQRTAESFCERCKRFVKPDVIRKPETYQVRGEAVAVDASVAMCPTCGEELSNETLDDATLVAAFSLYRARHHLLQPDEIKSVRLMYGLGQKAFSRLLGWGEITLHRYEGGSLQSLSQNGILELAKDPHVVRQLMERNGDFLSAEQRAKLERRLSELVSECADPVVREDPASYRARQACGVKLTEMMVYFATRPNTFRTKLNKLLFYADFLHFKRHGSPISASRYVHLQFGPVPDGFYEIQAILVADTSLCEVPVKADDWGGTVFKAGRPADTSVFDDSEMECLKYVADKFEGWSAKRLTDASHTEVAWLKTQDRETISYELASSLSLS